MVLGVCDNIYITYGISSGKVTEFYGIGPEMSPNEL